MKKLIAAVAILLLMSGMALAEDTGRADWEHPWVDESSMARHTHDNGYDAPLGVGLDLVICEVGDISIEAQNKYDFNNGAYSGFLVGKINIWNMVKK